MHRINTVLLTFLMLLSLCSCRQAENKPVSEAYRPTENISGFTDVALPIPSAVPGAEGEMKPFTTQAPLNWFENEDGSMSAVLPGIDGDSHAEVQIGVTQGSDAEDAPDETHVSTAAPNVPPFSTSPPETSIMQPNTWTGPDTGTTLEEYEAMSGEAQTLFYYSFANADDFLSWYNAAKAASEAGKDYIEIGLDGTVSAGG